MEISILGEGLLCTIRKLLPQQLRRVMRLTALLLTVACIHVSARSYEQTVSFSGKNVPLTTVFASIEKQTGMSFFFNYEIIKNAEPVTLDVKNVALEDILTKVLSDDGLDFYRSGKTIFIVKKQPAGAATIGHTGEVSNQQINIKGQVTNNDGEALAGASVVLKSGKKGVITDEKGMFELKNVPSGSTLIISFAGYQKREVFVQDGQIITIKLSISANQLDEMQVIAYGQTNQRLAVGDVTVVKGEDIEKQPVNNPLLALEGRVPGLFLAQGTGLPGTGIAVQIRGRNSMVNGNDPFYVVDGVPYISNLLPNLGSVLGSFPAGTLQYGNPLDFINPSDIESISVLKDADATSIYGSRAANGAILITTKKGKAGQSRVDMNLQKGFGNVSRRLDLMNDQQYLAMRHEAIANDGLSIGPGDYDLNGTWDTTRYTNWQKAMLGNTAQYDNVNVNFSGGNTNTQILLGGAYHRETTVFPGNFSDQKESAHFGVNHSSNNQKFKIQFSGDYLFDDNLLPNVDLTGAAMDLTPVAPKLYNSDGTLNWAPDSTGASSWTNPLAALNNTYQNKTSNLIGNATLSYQLLQGLGVRCSLGYTNLQSNEIVLSPLTTIIPENRPFAQRTAQYGNNNITSWIVEPQLTYKIVIGKGELTTFAGGTFQRKASNGVQLSASGFNSDQLMSDIASATSLSTISTTNSIYKYSAAFGKIIYNWNDKYVVDLAGRRDGSSRFGSNNQFHDFWSVAGGWIFSQENIIKQSFPLLSFGKIRASYGTTGNDQIGDYQYLSLYQAYPVSAPYQGQTGLVSLGLPNPYLQWEATRKAEVGLELGVLDDRIFLNLNYYWNRSSNQLLAAYLPVITGFIGVSSNLPATVQNSGEELSATIQIFKAKNFTWSVVGNVTIPTNKLVSFPNFSQSAYSSIFVVGQPITALPVFHYLGVDSSSGLYRFATSKGGPSSAPDITADKIALVNPAPKFYGGIGSSIRYKGFSLDFLFQFVKQVGPNYFLGNFIAGQFNGGLGNQPVYLLNRWQKTGDIAKHQRYATGYDYYQQWSDASMSDVVYSDASYVRLKNASVSWQLPAAWDKHAILREARLYIQAQNLFTITHYMGLDPESTSSTTLPPLRVWAFGIKIGI